MHKITDYKSKHASNYSEHKYIVGPRGVPVLARKNYSHIINIHDKTFIEILCIKHHFFNRRFIFQQRHVVKVSEEQKIGFLPDYLLRGEFSMHDLGTCRKDGKYNCCNIHANKHESGDPQERILIKLGSHC